MIFGMIHIVIIILLKTFKKKDKYTPRQKDMTSGFSLFSFEISGEFLRFLAVKYIIALNTFAKISFKFHKNSVRWIKNIFDPIWVGPNCCLWLV